MKLLIVGLAVLISAVLAIVSVAVLYVIALLSGDDS